MHFLYMVLALGLVTWALPSPPTVYNPDDSPVSADAPTLFNPDGTPASSDNGKADKSLASPQGSTKNRKTKSGKWKGPAEKYFHESTFDAHYDGRFADRTLPPEVRTTHLRALLRTYLATMHSLGTETWIMHGSLLGWWWNRRIMPWDSDIDVQVTEPALSHLASYYNMSVHSFRDVEWLGAVDMGGRDVLGKEDGGTREERKYLLDINPRWKNGSYADRHNVIDARWVDMKTGLYIDITTVRWNQSSPVPGTLYCKDRHHYLSRQIFPLRTSTFEGVPAKIPYAYQELLAEEYGTESLVQTVFRKEGHWFDEEKLEWVSMSPKNGGKFRQYENSEENEKNPRKKAASRKKPNAKNHVRDEDKTSGGLKPEKGLEVLHPRRHKDGVLTVVWRLFVGV